MKTYKFYVYSTVTNAHPFDSIEEAKNFANTVNERRKNSRRPFPALLEIHTEAEYLQALRDYAKAEQAKAKKGFVDAVNAQKAEYIKIIKALEIISGEVAKLNGKRANKNFYTAINDALKAGGCSSFSLAMPKDHRGEWDYKKFVIYYHSDLSGYQRTYIYAKDGVTFPLPTEKAEATIICEAICECAGSLAGSVEDCTNAINNYEENCKIIEAAAEALRAVKAMPQATLKYYMNNGTTNQRTITNAIIL